DSRGSPFVRKLGLGKFSTGSSLLGLGKFSTGSSLRGAIPAGRPAISRNSDILGRPPALAARVSCRYMLFVRLPFHLIYTEYILQAQVLPKSIRVRPISSSRVTKLSQHEADRGEFQEREGIAVEIFPILGEAAATVEPRNGALDDRLYNVAKLDFEWSTI